MIPYVSPSAICGRLTWRSLTRATIKHTGVLSKAAAMAVRFAGLPIGGAESHVLFEMYNVAALT